jgi:hypothetical protein
MQASSGTFAATVAGAAMTVTHTVTVTLPSAAAPNELIPPDGDLETGIGNWATNVLMSNVSGVPTRVTTPVHSGSASLQIQSLAAGTMAVQNLVGLGVTVGNLYSAAGWLRAAASARTVQVGIAWVDASGSPVGSTSFGVGVVDSTSGWVQAVVMGAQAPPGAFEGDLVVQVVGTGGALETHYVADMTLVAGATFADPAAGYGPDWSLAVDSLVVDRQLTTDMPDGTRLITGYPSARADVTLSGMVDPADARKTVAWLLNPAEPTSPMFRRDAAGSPVVIQSGLELPGSAAPELFTIFTGQVDDYTVDDDGTVTLTCLDYKTKISGPVMLPSVYDDNTGDGRTLSAQFPLDALLRNEDIYSWPAQRTNCVLAAGMRGNAYAELGGTLTSLSRWTGITDPLFEQGASAGMGLTGRAVYALSPTITGNTTPISAECWFDYQGDPGAQGAPSIQVSSPATSTTVTFTADDTTMSAVIDVDGTAPHIVTLTVNLPKASGYHGWQLTWTTTSVSLLAWRGGASGGPASSAITTRPATVFTTATVQASTGTVSAAATTNVIDSVQLFTLYNVAWNNAFTPGAVLDASLNWLTVVPDTSGQDGWSVIQQIAQAEAAVAGFDELGVFRFINRISIQLTPAVRTITPTYSLKSLQQEVGLSMIRNHIDVPVAPVQVQPFSIVWAAAEAIIIEGRATRRTTVTTDNPVVGLATTTGVINGGGLGSMPPYISGYRASKNPNATGAVTNLTMTVRQVSSTQIEVTVVNPNAFRVYLISPTGVGYPASSDGLPCLVLTGHFATPSALTPDSTEPTSAGLTVDSQWPPASEGGAATNPRGDQLLSVNANPWIQQPIEAQRFADDLLVDLYKPRPLWRNVAVVADPRLQLTDRVTVTDPDVSMVDDDALCIGVHTTLSKTDWSQALDLRAMSTPGGWLMGVVGRSEMGVSTYV